MLPTFAGALRRLLPSRRTARTLLTGGAIPWTAVVLLVVMAPMATVAIQQPDATPVATQTSVTPIATPQPTTNARCSVVLGIGDEGDACVAFVQAIPGLEPADLTLGDGDEPNATGIVFGDYVDFIAAPTAREVQVQITGNASSGLLIADAALTLEPDVAYVVVLEQAYDGDGPALTAVPVDLAPLGPEESRVSFHHAVTDAAPLSVLGLTAPSDKEIGPGQTTDPIIVEAGSITVDVVPGNDPNDVLATLAPELEPGLSYLIVISGTTGDETVQIIYSAAPVATED